MRRITLTLILLAVAFITAGAQTTMEECITLARENYPQIKEFNLIEESMKYDIANARLSWAPQLNVSGKATYQSEVVEMPFDIPGFEFDLPHDQYSIVGEISQSVWDGGTTRSQKNIIRSGAEVQKKQLEVSMYSIRERVQNIYLGILLIDKQLRQNEILMKSLERNLHEVQACIESGVAYQSDLNIVKVNMLNCKQQAAELKSDRASYVAMLSKMTGKDMSGMTFAEPSDTYSTVSEINRPEMALYDAQIEQNEAQRTELNSRISPKFNITLQGGAGRPGLNMLKNEFQPYYVAGIKMQWNIGALYTRRNDIRKINTQKNDIEVARETFLFNTSLDVTDQLNEISKARSNLEQDKEIVKLREDIRIAGEEQYANGIIKMTDLMDMIDDEHNARVTEAVHQIQLLMAIYKLKNSTGEQ